MHKGLCSSTKEKTNSTAVLSLDYSCSRTQTLAKFFASQRAVRFLTHTKSQHKLTFIYASENLILLQFDPI